MLIKWNCAPLSFGKDFFAQKQKKQAILKFDVLLESWLPHYFQT